MHQVIALWKCPEELAHELARQRHQKKKKKKKKQEIKNRLLGVVQENLNRLCKVKASSLAIVYSILQFLCELFHAIVLWQHKLIKAGVGRG